ncbi:metal-sulfur cluster assembly factor [Amycolatopsis australiensis]|uniref:Metal-sulfur cluster biosynthetic enzyme n=1 Tax=Amycolatopsis australiensis TaxID=546364 RepID=A0A1K1S7M7_9PSEU|nr:iron-sulfur cluster assembly protein [Amycolatopsis australiensis]SFW80087.1 Metal-sulfur cluster biosynthetic enzyme [Amycolatopsis australiensis]
MTTAVSVEAEVLAALATVLDPELDQPVTELGFVRSVRIDDDGVEVHLRLPTSFCAPNFAYLMVSDACDALAAVPGAGRVRVLLDDHHDSEKINRGVAAGAGYVGTFGVEAEDSLEELRRTFRRKAHLAAVERCCRAVLAGGAWTLEELPLLELFDLPEGPLKTALLRRREALGLPTGSHSRVLVGHDGTAVTKADSALWLRLAAATRVSIEGNAHFCRGLLATRYGDADPAPLVTNTRSRS